MTARALEDPLLLDPPLTRHPSPRAGSTAPLTAGIAGWLRHRTATTGPVHGSIRYWDRPAAHVGSPDTAPVFLVHGYAGSEHTWTALRARLASAGFTDVTALRYNAFRADIGQTADWLVERAVHSMRAGGATGVHLIGHSLGGLVVREAAGRPQLADRTLTAITLATPHGGTRLAHCVPGPTARQMRPGSPFLQALHRRPAAAGTRWVSFYGTADRVVPPTSAHLAHGPSGAVTICQHSAGHGAIPRHPAVVAEVVRQLLLSERLLAQSFSLAA